MLKHAPNIFTMHISDNLLAKISLNSPKIALFYTFFYTVMMVEMKHYNQLKCDMNPMAVAIKPYVMAQVASEKLYDVRVDDVTFELIQPTMDLHNKFMIYVIILWAIHSIPSAVSYMMKRSTDFKVKPFVDVFREIDKANLSFFENFTLVKIFLQSMSNNEKKLKMNFYKFTVIIILTSDFSQILAMIIFGVVFGYNFTLSSHLSERYYFHYEYSVIGGSGFIQCFWPASKMMNVAITIISYLYIITSIFYIHELVSIYLVTLKSFIDLLAYYVDKNVSSRQSQIIQMVGMGLMDCQFGESRRFHTGSLQARAHGVVDSDESSKSLRFATENSDMATLEAYRLRQAQENDGIKDKNEKNEDSDETQGVNTSSGDAEHSLDESLSNNKRIFDSNEFTDSMDDSTESNEDPRNSRLNGKTSKQSTDHENDGPKSTEVDHMAISRDVVIDEIDSSHHNSTMNDNLEPNLDLNAHNVKLDDLELDKESK